MKAEEKELIPLGNTTVNTRDMRKSPHYIAEDKKLPLTSHLKELRTRLIVSLVFWAMTSVISFIYWPSILKFLTPEGMTFVYISPEEALITRFKISIITGLFLSSPVILFQGWKFVKPALKPREKRFTIIFGIISLILFFCAAYFNLVYAAPSIIRFFMKVSRPELTPLISIAGYATFLINMTLAFSLISQLPILMTLSVMAGFVTYHELVTLRSKVIILNFIIAAIITPPDVFSQVVLAVPMCILYELGLLLAKFIRV